MLFFKNIKTKYCHVEFSIRSLAILANASTIFSAAIRAHVPMAILELIVKYVIRDKKNTKKQNQPNSNSFIIYLKKKNCPASLHRHVKTTQFAQMIIMADIRVPVKMVIPAEIVK